MSRLVNAAKQIKIKDILAPVIFLLLLAPSLIFKISNRVRGRKLWLIAEDGNARDNGYHFFKYVRTKHPTDNCFYAVKQNSAGYKKVIELGHTIKWGGIKHWLYYMAADLNISSQKAGNPCPIFWYVLHVLFGLYDNRVFLQHGVTHNNAKWIYYEKTKFKYFICATKSEYEYVMKTFGYPKRNVVLAGFARWDNLADKSSGQKCKKILIMPTWRKWLGDNYNKVFAVNDFKDTQYYDRWNTVMNDESFIKFIEEKNIKVYFYPHNQMQKFLSDFKTHSKNIEIVSMNKDIQIFFNTCDLMITDYSSVAFDFAYLEKPVIYYQFDEKEFRSKQYGAGDFDYRKNGFGPVVSSQKELNSAVRKLITDGMSNQYVQRIRNTFITKDNMNSERIYSVLSEDKKRN